MDRVRTDTFAILQAEWDQHWVDFLKGELALGFTFSALAATSYGSGNRMQAEQSVAHAKEAYATVTRYLSDPERFKYLSGEEIQEFTAELERLRDRLDELPRDLGSGGWS